eukprot:5200312-Amphidinium_carterae.1
MGFREEFSRRLGIWFGLREGVGGGLLSGDFVDALLAQLPETQELEHTAACEPSHGTIATIPKKCHEDILYNTP